MAKNALRRAKDKQPKEERDVLFIERILKMLKPGGRAAIVLPQGKFNNSSLAFIREWILKKARLLAVVGLHPNTFKPHTGTKTSVLFVQKYTQAQIDQIAKVHDEVGGACPDYAVEIQGILADHKEATDVPEEAIPEAVADLIAETYAEPEPEEAVNADAQEEGEAENEDEAADQEDRLAQAEEKLNGLKAALVQAKQQLMDLESDAEALKQQQEAELTALAQQTLTEVEAFLAGWKGTKGDMNAGVKNIQAQHKVAEKALKAEHKAAQTELKQAQKDKEKALKAEIKALDKQIPQAEIELKLLSNRGKLELVLADAELIGALKERWIAAEVAKKLDYPIFMAVSERGGKDNSGDYQYLLDEEGSLVEFPDDHPQEGQLVIDQDLVNYNLRAEDLANAAAVSDEQLCVAEAFIRFAQEQKLSFWGGV